MADVRALIFCCIALTTLNLSSSFELPNLNMSDLSQFSGSGLELPHLNRSEFSFPHLPFFSQFFGGGRKRRDTGFQFPHLNMSDFGLPDFGSGFQLPNFGSGFPQLPSFPSFFGSDRTRRDTESAAENEEANHQDRFFHARFPTITSCNTTTQVTLSRASGLEGIPQPNFNISELGLTEISRAGFPFNPFSFFSSLPFFDALSRSKRQIEPANVGNEAETQGDSPISKDPIFVNCNSTQIGSTCLNCHQVLICSRNFGMLRSCFGLRRYCNEGRCSNQQPTDCPNV